MISCITTVKQGAMPQFTIQVHKSLQFNGIDSCIFMPESDEITVEGINDKDIHSFELLDATKDKKRIASEIANELINSNTDEVWFCDESYTSLSIAQNIVGKIKYKFFVHDAKPHIYSFDIKRLIRFKYFSILRNKIFNSADSIVLMSHSSKDKFAEYYPKCADKLQVLLLGAHIPDINGVIPSDMPAIDDYYMFFGTIEKYKNVYGLLKAFSKYKGTRKLIVAGNGKFQEEEIELLNELKDRVVVINRFIKDEELVYLFEHARCVVLPYIEASQSGVLAMAFHFGNPVIVSDLPGLTEFVDNKANGYIYNKENELTQALNYIDTCNDYENMRIAARKYSEEKLDFNKNIKSIL